MTTVAPTRPLHLDVPGACLYAEVRGDGPPVVLVGAPMDADAFAPLADLLAHDRTVVTTDPRGIHRSVVADRTLDCPPALRAADVAALVTHLDLGPVDVVGSSGGAVTALALVERHPQLVRTAVVHEPPLDELVADRERLRDLTGRMIAAHRSGDVFTAWRIFLQAADITMPDEAVEAFFVAKANAQQEVDERYQFEHMLRATVSWTPDLPLLTSSSTRVVVGIGEHSAGQLCDRTSRALAEGLGVAPVSFPGGHVGFLDDPAGFATRLRDVLDATPGGPATP